jgi:hypothetical protein
MGNIDKSTDISANINEELGNPDEMIDITTNTNVEHRET